MCAWRSSGGNNSEMVNNLKRFGVISSETVEKGFRSVDRKFFVPKGHEEAAHSDQPLKEGNVHISAPHIYGSALEALELRPDSTLSFLNIGSGTGYLSCIVAAILGPKSLNFGIEIHQDVVEHSKKSIEQWTKSRQAELDAESEGGSSAQAVPHLEIIRGNALHISPCRGESLVGFDRIYVGAAVERSSLSKITKLLSPGGILVGPVDDELVKVVRIGPIDGESTSQEGSGSSDEDDRSDADNNSNEFTQQVLSGVRFAPLATVPIIETVIPSRVWNPSIHGQFPDSFQQASMQLLMCSNAQYLQPPPRPKRRKDRVNLAAMLPRVLWMEILSYTHRKWFEPQQTETEFLRKRLLEEQANAAKAQQARLEAEVRCHVAERERDVYRLLARRWQSRLHLVLQQQRQASSSGRGSSSSSASAAAASASTSNESDTEGSIERIISGEEERSAIFGLGAMLRQLHGDDDDGDQEEMFVQSEPHAMEEDNEDDVDEEVGGTSMIVNDQQQLIDLLEDERESDDEYEFQSFQSEPEVRSGTISGHPSGGREEENDSMMVDENGDGSEGEGDDMSKKPAQLHKQQLRTVSISSDDL